MDYKDTFRDEPFMYHKALLNVILKTTITNAD